MAELARIYTEVYASLESGIPRNTESGSHFLDREVIEAYCVGAYQQTSKPYQTVRGGFAEGDPIYPGSKILRRAHNQIAVRDQSCILRAALVQWR